jgi:glycosyltransferase involved in cell wall biosynthesis
MTPGEQNGAPAIRAVVIDPAIRPASGHHLDAAVAIALAARSAGHDPVWIAHKDVDPASLPGVVTLVRAFSSTTYQNQIGLLGRALRPHVGDRHFLRKALRERSWEVSARRRLGLRILNGDRLAELDSALQSLRLTALDHLIVPSADPQTLDILTAWVSRTPRRDQPDIHVRTCWSGRNMPFADYAGGFAEGARRLARLARHVTFSCETSASAKSLRGETGLEVAVVPHFVDMTSRPTRRDREEAESVIVVGWLGEPRIEKGTDALISVIRRTLNVAGDHKWKFVLQCAGKKKRWLDGFNASLDEFGAAVERAPVAMSRQLFMEMLEKCTIVFMPYDPRFYPPERGSGVAVEAVLSGKPIVAREGTFAAELVTPDSGIVGADPVSLSDGLIRVANDLRRFQAGAAGERERGAIAWSPARLYRKLIGLRDGSDDGTAAAAPRLAR